MEIWKDIKGYEGIYQISNFGRVKSLENEIITKTGVRKIKGEKILKGSVHSKGYRNVLLTNESGKKREYVHRIVALTFIPNPEAKTEVNHKDGNKQNNHVDNLEWSTSSENSFHAIKNNLQIAPKKKIKQFDKNGNFIKLHNSLTEASLELGIHLDSISRNLRGKSKTAGGYKWEYDDTELIVGDSHD